MIWHICGCNAVVMLEPSIALSSLFGVLSFLVSLSFKYSILVCAL